VVAGDNLISFDISDFVDYFESDTGPCLAAYDIGSIDQASEYGVLELDDDTVIGFAEKPDDPESTLISIACYAFPADLLTLFTEYLNSGNNPDEPGWFIQWLYPQEPVQAFTFDGAWFDIGTPDSYLEAVEWALDGENIIADSASIEHSTIGNNVHIMENATISDSDIDSSIVFPNVVIDGCDLRSSIIDEDTTLENLNLAGALIGAHTQIANGN
jgi:glucose-1-phosphate thymidylyltransferase